MSIAKTVRVKAIKSVSYDFPAISSSGCRLNLNESPFDIPLKIKKRILRKIAKASFNRYPDASYARLRRAIAGIYGLKEENVAVGAGIDAMLVSIFFSFVEKGDKVLMFAPTFDLYRFCCELVGAREVAIPLCEDFSLPEKFANESQSSKLTIICRPNNPTGTSIPLETVERIVRGAGGLVCIDEAYAEFAEDNCLNLLKYQNVLILRTLSKAFSAAGVRIGFALGSKDAIAAINKIRLPFNISILSQIAAEEIINSRKLFACRIEFIKSERERVASKISLLGMKAYPSQANFVLFLPQSPKMIFDSLLSKGVLVRRLSSPYSQYLRVSIGAKEENNLFLAKLFGASVDAALFDLDNTLVDVRNSCLEAIRLTAEQLSGSKISIAQVLAAKAKAGMNNDWDATVEVLRQVGIKADIKQVVPFFQSIYFGKRGDGLIKREKPLVSPLLLAKIKKPIGIITGRPRLEAKLALRLIGLPESTPLVALEDTKKPKPDPSPLLLAKNMLRAKNPAYFGDSPDDAAAAAAAGMPFVAIGNGIRQKGEFASFLNVNLAIKELLL